MRGVVEGIGDGLVDPTSAAIGLVSIVVIVALRTLHSRVPGVLVAVAGSMLVVAAAGWRDEIAVVGSLPSGLPAPALGGLTWSDVGSLLGPALGVALIAFADTGVMSRAMSARRGESVDGNDEMRALGIANAASGLFGGFSVSGSFSRTPVAEQAGARTQLTGVTGALMLIAFILLVPDLTSYLPSSALAAVVIVAASSFVDVPGVVHLLRRAPVEGALSLAAFAGVAVIGVLEGIVVALGLSVIAFVNQAWRPYRAELGQIAGIRGYHDLSRNPEAQRIDAIAIVRFDAPLFFANAGIFAHFVRRWRTPRRRCGTWCSQPNRSPPSTRRRSTNSSNSTNTWRVRESSS
jgi:MFS superfamily sulfate permease-like transporter